MLSIRIKVQAGARKETFAQISENVFEIHVREKAERNEANERVRALIARHFKVSMKNVRILSGQRGSIF